MNTYLESYSFAVTASSSKSWATHASTKAFSGYLHAMYLSPDASNPLLSASSSYFQLRADSTSGRVLARSSSGVNGTRYWFPKHIQSYTTAGTNFGLEGMRMPVVNEKIVLCKIAGATSGGGGSSEGMALKIFIEGVHS